MNICPSHPKTGSTEQVFLAHVYDLNDFYLHSESVRDSLVKLGEDLYNEYSESSKQSLQTNETLNVNDYCACPSSDQKTWHRGIIHELDSNGNATVFKIDYGDVQYISIQFLRPLKKQFFQLPRLAFNCTLVNLIKPTTGWPLKAIQDFRSQLISTEFLYAKCIYYNEIRYIYEIEITKPSSKTPLNKDFEHYQTSRSTLELNDKSMYSFIRMEVLDLLQSKKIRILYYVSPSHFYVYLQEKTNFHTHLQITLQKSMQNNQQIFFPGKYSKYLLVAARDNHAIWHRAITLDSNSDETKICVYFIDIGQSEYISIHNIRILPQEFQLIPAFAIPCRLGDVYPIDENKQLIFQSNDPVHNEFIRLTASNINCTPYKQHEQIYYDVKINIDGMGDLGTLLFQKNLVTRQTIGNFQHSTFRSNQPQQSFAREQDLSPRILSSIQQQRQQGFTQSNKYYRNSNNMSQQRTRMSNIGLQNVIVQSSSNISTNTSSSSTVSIIPPQNGVYSIIRVHTAAEFYGLSQNRETEFANLSKNLADYYNNAPNDPSLSVPIFVEGALCVMQEDDKYHRVTMKHCESGSRVIVKLIDRGDEIIVDMSELLQIDNKFSTIAAFAEPFRLHGYDEFPGPLFRPPEPIQTSANITLTLKKLILNQCVHISQQGPIMNGFYPVEVILNNQSVNQKLLSNDKNFT